MVHHWNIFPKKVKFGKLIDVTKMWQNVTGRQDVTKMWQLLTGPWLSLHRLDPKKSKFNDSCPDTFGWYLSGFMLAYQLFQKIVWTPDLVFLNPKNFPDLNLASWSAQITIGACYINVQGYFKYYRSVKSTLQNVRLPIFMKWLCPWVCFLLTTFSWIFLHLFDLGKQTILRKCCWGKKKHRQI